MRGTVVAVSRAERHCFSKEARPEVTLLAGIGVQGDAHAGSTVKHRSRLARDPTRPNLRQIHLLHSELLEALNARGFDLAPGAIGENVLTRGIDLLGLPQGARLRLGPTAEVAITGLRNPCRQLDRFRPGLMQAVLGRDLQGRLVRKAGVMAIVLAGGVVRPGDEIAVHLPPEPHLALDVV